MIIHRVEFKQFFGMNFVSLVEPEREFKVCNSCKCSQIIRSIHHTNTYNVLQYNTNTYCISVMYTAYNLWTFTWIVHSELPFRLNGTDKIHTKELLKFHSMYNQFSVVIFSLLPRLLKYLGFTISDFFKNRPAVWQFSTLKKKHCSPLWSWKVKKF